MNGKTKDPGSIRKATADLRTSYAKGECSSIGLRSASNLGRIAENQRSIEMTSSSPKAKTWGTPRGAFQRLSDLILQPTKAAQWRADKGVQVQTQAQSARPL